MFSADQIRAFFYFESSFFFVSNQHCFWLRHAHIHTTRKFQGCRLQTKKRTPQKKHYSQSQLYVRKNQKPYFLEVSTYRYSGHVGPEGDDHYGYRPKKEIEYWKQ